MIELYRNHGGDDNASPSRHDSWRVALIGILAVWSVFTIGCATTGNRADLEVSVQDNRLMVYPAGDFSRHDWQFDTGSDLTLLDEESFRGLRLQATEASANLIDVSGHEITRPIEILEALPLKQRNRNRPYTLRYLWVVRLPKLRERTGFDAILGYRPFEQRVLQLDLGNERVRIVPRAPRGPGVYSLPFRLEAWNPMVGVTTSTGKAFEAVIDTGSDGWFSLTAVEAESLGSLELKKADRTTKALYGDAKYDLLQFDGDFYLGNASFHDPFVKEIPSNTENLIGIQPLQFFRITLDPQAHRAAVDISRMPWTRAGLPPNGVKVSFSLQEE